MTKTQRKLHKIAMAQKAKEPKEQPKAQPKVESGLRDGTVLLPVNRDYLLDKGPPPRGPFWLLMDDMIKIGVVVLYAVMLYYGAIKFALYVAGD